MKRLYYVGDVTGHTDQRLPGVMLSYGNAVDVHDDALAAELEKLAHFSPIIVAMRPVERKAKAKAAPKKKVVPDDPTFTVEV